MDPVPHLVNPVKSVVATQVDPADAPVSDMRHTLVDLSREFVFFTTGVLHAAIPQLSRDLVKDFIQASPELLGTGSVGAVDTQGTPLFADLGSHLCHGEVVDMNRRLYAIRKDKWDDCRRFIGGAVFISPVTAKTYRVVLYKLALMDRVTLSRLSIVTTPPEVEVTVFAVTDGDSFFYLRPVSYPDTPRLTIGPGFDVTALSPIEADDANRA
jgi:hypothetical protein